MIDERQEELASLYAFDLLEGAELAQFETALARNPELQTLVRDLRDASAGLAHTASVTAPPATLKQRVLASIDSKATSVPGRETESDNVIRPALFRGWNLIPWAAAACFALGALWLGQRYLFVRSEVAALRNREQLANIAIESTRQQLEAERIVNRARLQGSEQQLATANTQLGEARTQLTERDRLLAEVRTQLSDRDRQLADGRSQINDRERQVATLTQRIESLAAEMKAQGDLANLKIAALASLNNTAEARAIAVWNPSRQEGLFEFEKLPAVAADQKLELWVIESKEGAKPVSAGVLNVRADGSGRVRFIPTTPVTALAKFAVSREKNDGLPSHATPTEVIMIGDSR